MVGVKAQGRLPFGHRAVVMPRELAGHAEIEVQVRRLVLGQQRAELRGRLVVPPGAVEGITNIVVVTWVEWLELQSSAIQRDGPVQAAQILGQPRSGAYHAGVSGLQCQCPLERRVRPVPVQVVVHLDPSDGSVGVSQLRI